MTAAAVTDDSVRAGTQMVSLAALHGRTGRWRTVSLRNHIDQATVERYWVAMMDDGVEMPPILVYWDGRQYWVADGGHRLEATKKGERRRILAEVRLGSQKDARWASFGCNARHGLQRTLKEKRAEVEAAVKEYPDRSTTDIARQCQVSEQFVRNKRAEVERETNGVSQSTRLNARGQRRPAHIHHPGRMPKLVMVPRTPGPLPLPSTPVTKEPTPDLPVGEDAGDLAWEEPTLPPGESPDAIRARIAQRRVALKLLWERVNAVKADLDGLQQASDGECQDLLAHWTSSPVFRQALWDFLAEARPGIKAVISKMKFVGDVQGLDDDERDEDQLVPARVASAAEEEDADGLAREFEAFRNDFTAMMGAWRTKYPRVMGHGEYAGLAIGRAFWDAMQELERLVKTARMDETVR